MQLVFEVRRNTGSWLSIDGFLVNYLPRYGSQDHADEPQKRGSPLKSHLFVHYVLDSQYRRQVILCVAKRGKAAANTFRKKDCAARALLANVPYISAK